MIHLPMLACSSCRVSMIEGGGDAAGWSIFFLLLVILASAWKQVSYNFLFFLAGLQAIPKSVVEAVASGPCCQLSATE